MAKQNCVNSSLTAHGIQVADAAGVGCTSTILSDGQLLIGSSGVAPVAATLSAGTGISITPGAGSLTITNTGGGGGGVASITGINGLDATDTGGGVYDVGVAAANPTIASEGTIQFTASSTIANPAGAINLDAYGATGNTNSGRINLAAYGDEVGGGVINLTGNAGASSGEINLTTTDAGSPYRGKIELDTNQVQITADPNDFFGGFYVTSTQTDLAVPSVISLTATGLDNQVVGSGVTLQATKGNVVVATTAAPGAAATGVIELTSQGDDSNNTGRVTVSATANDIAASGSGVIAIDAIGVDGGVSGQGSVNISAGYGQISLTATPSTGISSSGRVQSNCPLWVNQGTTTNQPFRVTNGAQSGTAVLVAGTVTVTNSWVTGTEVIVATHKAAAGTIGHLQCQAGVGNFTINSLKANTTLETSDTSTVQYWII